MQASPAIAITRCKCGTRIYKVGGAIATSTQPSDCRVVTGFLEEEALFQVPAMLHFRQLALDPFLRFFQ